MSDPCRGQRVTAIEHDSSWNDLGMVLKASVNSKFWSTEADDVPVLTEGGLVCEPSYVGG
jgi:hypothetical protein